MERLQIINSPYTELLQNRIIVEQFTLKIFDMSRMAGRNTHGNVDTFCLHFLVLDFNCQDFKVTNLHLSSADYADYHRPTNYNKSLIF